MKRLQILLLIIVPVASCAILCADTPTDEEAAIQAIRRVASNIQKNRDGTVRFVRFSRPLVTDEHLSHVRALKRLDYLAVVTPSVTDDGLSHIEALSNLDTLFLSDSSLTDAGMPALGRLEKLQRLYLDRTQITDAGLKHIAGLKTLTTISLRGTKITDAGLERLAELHNLETLVLGQTAISDDALKHLTGLTKLRTLVVDRCDITGSGLKHLAALSTLETLNLSGTKVTANSLSALAGLGALKQLLLYETPAGSESLVELRAAMTKTNFHVSPAAGHERNALERFLAGEQLSGSSSPASVETAKREAADVSAAPDQRGPVLSSIKQRIAESDEAPDFQRHVIPILGRLGCNGRTCHGSFQGRGGFRLSMFGYDFAADHEALGQRVDLDSPEHSLILLKPTLEEEHEGGKRYEKDGWEYQLLRRWIQSGAKGGGDEPQKIVGYEVTPAEVVFTRIGEEVQLQAVAVWSDGTREDVTCLTRFQTNDDTVAEVTRDGRIRCKGPGDTHVISFYDKGIVSTPVLLPLSDRIGDQYPKVPTPTPIDERVVEKLAKLGVVPSELCSDEEFLRRVSLDLAGTLPTPGEVQSFVADKSTDKRDRKIDELLASPAYVEWWTVRLSDLTGSNAQYLGTTDMNQPAAVQWNSWIRRRLRDNDGWDRIAAGLILAESRRPGQTYEQYAAEQSMYLRRQSPNDFTAPENPMHYYWFRSNNQQPADRALSFGYVFLGVRLQCAQCHKHPFDRWSKQDFESFTQFFTRIKAGVAPDARPAQSRLKTKLGVPVKLDTAALRRQMYLRVAAEGLPIPWNEIWVEPPDDKPQVAKLLGDTEIDLSRFDDPREPLMAWLLGKDNPYFARAFVNRIWAHYFGVGIVDPPDDFNMANPPSNQALLDWLSSQFVERGYDIRWLHKAIAGSRTYQLSWRQNATNRNDQRNFSHARIRRLPAEVTIDAILQSTASDAAAKKFATDMNGRKIAQHPKSIQTRGIDYSLLVFGKPLRSTNCDCERQMQPTLLQSLYARNDHELLEWLERKDGWLAQVAKELGQTLAPEAATANPQDRSNKAVTDSASARIDELIRSAYLRTLCRLPRDSESKRARVHLAASENTVEGLRDLMWALLNTQEFRTNH